MRLARLIHRQIGFSLYEEGTGTVEIPEADRPVRVSRVLGAVSAFGESRLMEEVWTYSPAAVRARLPNRNVMPITRSLADFVRCNRDLLMDTFWPSFHEDRQLWRGRRCCLYLSSWEVQAQAYSYLASADAFTICKLHPHIRDFVEMPPTVDQLIRSSVPAELLILELARVFEAVAESNRRRILELLCRGPMPVGELVEQIGLSQPATSKHLRVLRDVVQDGRIAQEVLSKLLLGPVRVAPDQIMGCHRH